MRIVIDMQGAQTESRFRGIGRYTLSLTKAMARNKREHEVIIALNGLFPDTIEPIRETLEGLVPQEDIHVWYTPGPVRTCDSDNRWRRETAEYVREAFLANLRPDIVHISSLFEGYTDDAVTSIGNFSKGVITAVTLYDLIPFIHPDSFLAHPFVKNWYFKKIDQLRKADLVLSISESSRREGMVHLGLSAHHVINVSSAADDHFRRIDISSSAEDLLRRRYGIQRAFVMYTGGIDPRKNIEGLIRAFARLPAPLRSRYQLVIVCSIRPDSQNALERIARRHGLDKGELVLTGFVPEDDLLALYNLCELFVFPSWHEGFGLPALEAMLCGAPVIAANTSSLPEVIGLEEALFDPHSEGSLAEKMEEALRDSDFRCRLIDHGRKQAGKFSWDESARRAVAAFEGIYNERRHACVATASRNHRRKLAYVSPVPPDRSGIAYYSAELLPELSRYYDIEIVVSSNGVTDPEIGSRFPIRNAEWFEDHADCFDRVLYQFGNSEFHSHMFGLLERIPGVVVLHDFFLSGILAHLELSGVSRNVWIRELYESHGYEALRARCRAKDLTEVIWRYPCNVSVLAQAMGIIVHSRYSVHLADAWYGRDIAADWSIVPHLRVLEMEKDREGARKSLGLQQDDFLVCSFGMLGPTKLNHRLLHAWLHSFLSSDPRCLMVFVGENHAGDYGKQLLKIVAQNGLGERVRVTGWADVPTFRKYLAAADLAVQLRTLSRGETSGTILDCMNHGLPTIVNANGSFAEFSPDSVWMLPDEFTDNHLIEALETLRRDEKQRVSLGNRAREVIQSSHSPSVCAARYAESIEKFYSGVLVSERVLVKALAECSGAPSSDKEWRALAASISQNMGRRKDARRLFLDISSLVHNNPETESGRIARSIMHELLLQPSADYRVDPVYADTGRPGYRHAFHFTMAFLGCPGRCMEDEPIDARPGDIFLSLGLEPQTVTAQKEYLLMLHRNGVHVFSIVYDLLPCLFPRHFPSGEVEAYEKWLHMVACFDGAICVSRSAANELAHWLETNGPKRIRPFNLGWFQPGTNDEYPPFASDLPAKTKILLKQLKEKTCFLMIGTLEPHKGHEQVLSAFDRLWGDGHDVRLVIAGRQGRTVDSLVERIKHHRESGQRLCYLDDISDEHLEHIFKFGDCLIAASEEEGFGLSLIEAARHKLPLIVRDIPVFRETAGDHAFYFSGVESADLAQAIEEWFGLFTSDLHPKSEGIPWLTWKESAEQLKRVLFEGAARK
ncbi:MAG TPA: glycosyltransferase [Syntrophales bacterium]|nr:glycosyltransferase [Syntrophales bacterium]